MRIWVDPEVPPQKQWIDAAWISSEAPPKYWERVWVKTVREAQDLLLRGDCYDVSTTYSFGSKPCRMEVPCFVAGTWTCIWGCGCCCHQELPTGADLIRWIAEEQRWPQRMFLHGGSPLALLRMKMLLRRAPRDCICVIPEPSGSVMEGI